MNQNSNRKKLKKFLNLKIIVMKEIEIYLYWILFLKKLNIDFYLKLNKFKYLYHFNFLLIILFCDFICSLF
jgi:hypothetical protein